MKITVETQGGGDMPEHVQVEVEPKRVMPLWAKTAMLAVGGAVVAAGAAVVTLALTTSAAVEMNANAYINGLNDGYAACLNEW
jgi:hypothetical protein